MLLHRQVGGNLRLCALGLHRVTIERQQHVQGIGARAAKYERCTPFDQRHKSASARGYTVLTSHCPQRCDVLRTVATATRGSKKNKPRLCASRGSPKTVVHRSRTAIRPCTSTLQRMVARWYEQNQTKTAHWRAHAGPPACSSKLLNRGPCATRAGDG